MVKLIYFLVANLAFVFGTSAIYGIKIEGVVTEQAKEGDGAYSLLRRYNLEKEYCNIEQFFKMNKLKEEAALIVGTEYKIPIYKIRFNGNSIRSTLKMDDWELAVKIRDFNLWAFNHSKKEQEYFKDKSLWIPFHILVCSEKSSKIDPEVIKALGVEEVVVKNTSVKTPNTSVEEKTSSEKKSKSTTKTVKVPLFGTTEENVVIESDKLKGEVYYIVSGHGGPDSGAQCTTCQQAMCEDEYAYDVCLRLARKLIQNGAVAEVIVRDKNDGIRDGKYLDCDTDERYKNDYKIPYNQVKRLALRAKLINDMHASYKKKGFKKQKAVMIHVDSNNKNLRQDVYFYHATGSKTGKSMAENIQKTFKEKYDKFQKDRGYKGYVKERNLFMLRRTNPPATYIELANIRNRDDHKRLILSSNRQALADWIYEGLIR